MRVLFSTLFLLLPIINSSAIALGDWQSDTPNGNYMYDDGGGVKFVLRKPYQEIADVHKWYFFKGCTIGQCTKVYFIVNEQNSSVKTFANQQEWEIAIAQLNLKPLWTRWWYQDDWHILDDLLLIIVFGFFIAIPLFLVLVFRAIVYEHLNPRKPCTLIVVGIALITAIQHYLEANPISF